ncbi:TPA: SMI1/KNR4 family protein [Salmonella enterica]|nr:SMI1/KNR4 family protein [Salmonella enterica]
MFKSKYKPSRQLELITSRLSNFNINEYVKFLEKNNVVTLNGDYCIETSLGKLPVEMIYGVSKKECEDVFSINDKYENRIPEGYWIFSSANYGGFMCLGTDGKVYYWDHEINDLYFSQDGRGYLPQNKNLSLISLSFNSFLSSLKENKNNDDITEYDEMDDPNIPFKDGSLEYDFKHPEIFFKNSEELIPIYLKKLELSERGRELLALFKAKGLIE